MKLLLENIYEHMKDKDLLEESPKNIFHDLMISKIIKKQQFSSCKGGYMILSPLFFRLWLNSWKW